jgi:hypothetical protein
MTVGLFIAILAMIGIITVFGILYFLRRSNGKTYQMNTRKSNFTFEARAAQSGLQEIEIPKVPTYQKTKAPMTHLRTEIDRLKDGFDMAFGTGKKETDGEWAQAIEDDVKKLLHILQDARNAARILLAAVGDRPIDDLGKNRFDQGEQVITSPPPPRADAIADNLFRAFAVLRETINESNSCIAGFYFALTKKDETVRIAEARAQVALLVILFDNAIATLDALEDTL